MAYPQLINSILRLVCAQHSALHRLDEEVYLLAMVEAHDVRHGAYGHLQMHVCALIFPNEVLLRCPM